MIVSHSLHLAKIVTTTDAVSAGISSNAFDRGNALLSAFLRAAYKPPGKGSR